MSGRIDISPFLIHFTKGDNFDAAFKNIISIISSKTIIGTNNKIKGCFNCVCFTEAPIESLYDGLVNTNRYSKYSPFGIMVKKEWLFRLGGRPVIYQTESEYKLLNDNQKWRHVTYDPITDPPIDFSWEREWRINIDQLHINPEISTIVLPSKEWVKRFKLSFNHDQDMLIEQYKFIFDDEMLAELYREEFNWEIEQLND